MSLLPYKVTALARVDNGDLNIIPGASVTVMTSGGTYAQIYEADETTPILNPFNCDENGERQIYLSGGSYTISVAGGQSWEIRLSGASDIQSVATIADLRNTEPEINGQQIELLGHTVSGSGGGAFYYDEFDSSSEDNDGSVIVTAGNRRWKRRDTDVMTPEMFGAVGDGDYYDYPHFSNLISAVVARGGGHIIGDPSKIYHLVDDTFDGEVVFDIGSVTSFKMDFNGSTIKTTNVLAQGAIILFRAQNAKNIFIGNAVADLPLLVDALEDPTGASLFVGLDKCENIEIAGLSGYGGFNSIVAFERSDTSTFLAFSQQARGITVRDIELDAVGYGINCRFNGSFLRARNVKLDYCHRGYFPYGVTNHDVEIILSEFDATGARLWGVGGRVLRNIKLNITVNKVSGTERLSTSIVNLAFTGSQPGTIENIDVFINANLSGLHNSSVYLAIESPPTVGQHLLNGFKVRGTTLNPNGRYMTHTVSGGAITAAHLRVESLDIGGSCVGQVSASVFPVDNSTTIHKVTDLLMTSTPNTNFELSGATSTTKVVYTGCTAGRLYSSGAGDYIDCTILDQAGIVPKLCTFKNTTLAGAIVNKSLQRHVLPPNENTIQADLIGCRLVSQSAASSLTITLQKDVYIYPDKLPSVNAASCVYEFAIGVTSVSSSNFGVYSGKVMLKSDGTNITSIALINVSVVHSAGSSLTAGDLAVTLSSGSPVFTLTSASTNYTQAQLVIRDI